MQFGEAIGHHAHAVEVPDPVAVAIRPPLAKVFRIESHDLKQQLAGFVRVVVLGDGPAELVAVAVGLGPRLCLGGQRLDRARKIAAVEKSHQIDNIALGAAATAVENLLALPGANRKPILTATLWACADQFRFAAFEPETAACGDHARNVHRLRPRNPNVPIYAAGHDTPSERVSVVHLVALA